ncbi:hypothetical protein IUS37_15200 [Mycobacteroides abscessus subsp. abscessus]|uniref:hypothetical protein n=1 Tax=Mycobacteroides abscessus TaxID=36809 RepID=UPI0019D01410|nr:hypothetical protein [Mycobacteroides abscessus]MBN7407737.1 hypothetical protein [Mycobacteroides abscessus subsp. abscessus]
MTNPEKSENPTEPVPAVPPVAAQAPPLKKARNVGKVLSIATVAAGAACVLAATFGAGLMVGAHTHRHGEHRDRAAVMILRGGPEGGMRRGGGDWNRDRDRGRSGDHGRDWDRDRDRGGQGDRDQRGDRDSDGPASPGWQRTPPTGQPPGVTITVPPGPGPGLGTPPPPRP